MKPKYTYFYTSDNAIEDIFLHPPFSYEKPISKRIGRDASIIEFEHFDLYCFRMCKPNLSMRGHKTWQILVEDILYNELDSDYIQENLYHMILPYDILGRRIVKINKYNIE